MSDQPWNLAPQEPDLSDDLQTSDGLATGDGDEELDLPEEITDPGPGTGSPESIDPQTSRTGRRVDGGTLRRIAAKAIALAQASDGDRELLASLLGSTTTDPVALTAAVFRSTSAVLGPVTALLEIADQDPTFAAVAVMGWDKSRVRQVWNLAARLDLVTANRPHKDTDTAIKLSSAIQAMTPQTRQRLSEVAALTRRTA